MHRNPRIFRLTATVALAALLAQATVPPVAVAQPAPPPLPAPNQGRPDLEQPDPPARVGRIASLTGTVSFHNAGDTDWSAASLNYPVTGGNAFWTEPAAGAQLEIADSRIVLGGATEFAVTTLDPAGLQGVLAQGEAYVHLRDLAADESWSIQTPRGVVHLGAQGRYEIVIGDTERPTQVTVIDGAAQIEAPGLDLPLAANQTATITGTGPFQGHVGPAAADSFLTATLQAEHPPSAPVPAPVVLMAGGSDLAGIGAWSETPDYGEVWYPPVAAGWVPYREGHWAYVLPWGWTWIDDAPWGFAPFHYGRWIQIAGRWAWTPGAIAIAAPPVYAPALVSFIGLGAGVALGAAFAAGSIGWVPLGPREPFHPWYRASAGYVRQVNGSHVANVTAGIAIDRYANRGAATVIPAGAMTASRPVQSVARPVTAQEFAAAHPIAGQLPVHPTVETAGVTPAVARHLDLQAGRPPHAAPGPTIQAAPAGLSRPPSPQAATRPSPAVLPQGHPENRPAPARPEPQASTPLRPQATPEPSPHPAARPPEPARRQAAPETFARPAPRPPELVRPESVSHPEARPAPPRPETVARPETRPAPREAPQGAQRPQEHSQRPQEH